ncbi:MAG: hypothetical protein V1676_06490 [Candidatus Diapherotrites archaeon]
MVSKEIVGYARIAFLGGFVVALLSGFIIPEELGGYRPMFNMGVVLPLVIMLILGLTGVFIAFFAIKQEDEVRVLTGMTTLLVAAIAVFTVSPPSLAIEGYTIRGAISALSLLIGPLALVISFKTIFRAVLRE